MELSISDFHGAPVVLAFANDWTLVAESAAELDAIRAELRGLGAGLVVLSRVGIWSFRPDDDLERFRARDEEVAAEITRLGSVFGVGRGEDGMPIPTLLVLDGNGEPRFRHATAVRGNGTGSTLAEALANAGRALAARAHSDVVLSRREWVVASLVASFALFLLPGSALARLRAATAVTSGPGLPPAPR